MIDTFISGIRFQAISNYVLDRTSPIFYTNISPDVSKIKDGDIIWCYSEYIPHLFNEINFRMESGQLNKNMRCILITRNSDRAVDRLMFEKRPKCIKKWFAQNVDYRHDDLISIPIGLENDHGPSKGSYTDYNILKKYIESPLNIKVLDQVYCNFDINTNKNGRQLALGCLRKNNVLFQDARCGYDKYCENMSKFKFIASPMGSGIDCHRTWEALYLGNFPIVERHFTYDVYNMPIIQIESWEEINPHFLKNMYNELKDGEYDYEPLNINYWLDIILKVKKDLV
jgi:hypothetical protein